MYPDAVRASNEVDFDKTIRRRFPMEHDVPGQFLDHDLEPSPGVGRNGGRRDEISANAMTVPMPDKTGATLTGIS